MASRFSRRSAWPAAARIARSARRYEHALRVLPRKLPDDGYVRPRLRTAVLFGLGGITAELPVPLSVILFHRAGHEYASKVDVVNCGTRPMVRLAYYLGSSQR